MATPAEKTAAKAYNATNIADNSDNTAEDVRNSINEVVDIIDTDDDIQALARGAFTSGAGISISAQGVISATGGGGPAREFGIASFSATKGSDSWNSLALGDSINGSWTLRFTFENIMSSDPGNNPTYTVRLNGTQVGTGTADKSTGAQTKTLTLTGQPALVEGTTYTLQLSATFGSVTDTRSISRRIPVRMFYGLFASSMPSKSQVLNTTAANIATSNRLTFGRATNQYIGFYQPPGQADITQILTDGFNSIGGYTKVNDPFGDGSYEGWISNRQFTFPSGRMVEVRRS